MLRRGVDNRSLVWHGLTKPEHADTYESHLKPELLPGLSQKKGFRRSYLLRRAVGGGLDYFLTTVFNYPTLPECYKVAAFNAANKRALVRMAAASAADTAVAPWASVGSMG